MSMAAAYATVASGGIYCAPVAITQITDSDGESFKVPSAGCHRALSSDIADAVNYILQGVLGGGGTGAGLALDNGYPAAAKTGTSNVGNGNGTPYAAFAGYTTNLVSYTSVFNPISPTVDTMGGNNSCYRDFGGNLQCPGEMFGANAPGSTWHVTFEHANLGHLRNFEVLSPSSPLWSQGDGQHVVQQCSANTPNPNPTNSPTSGSTSCPPGKKGKGGKGGTGGGGTGGGGGGGGGNGGPPTLPPTLPPPHK
jgi:membrane peptidoglycan carboxypeptidase